MALAALSPAIVTVGAWLLGRSQPAPVVCHCECGQTNPEAAGALQLLERQLARCGPENLAGAPAPALGVELFLFVFVVGLVTGSITTLWVLSRPAKAPALERTPATPDHPEGAAAERTGKGKGAKAGSTGGRGEIVVLP